MGYHGNEVNRETLPVVIQPLVTFGAVCHVRDARLPSVELQLLIYLFLSSSNLCPTIKRETEERGNDKDGVQG